MSNPLKPLNGKQLKHLVGQTLVLLTERCHQMRVFYQDRNVVISILEVRRSGWCQVVEADNGLVRKRLLPGEWFTLKCWEIVS